MELIEQKSLQLEVINQRCVQLKIEKDSQKGFPPFKKKRIRKKQQELEELIKSFLEKFDDNYITLVQRNYKLLATERLLFKVSRTRNGMVGNYASKLKGKIQINGVTKLRIENSGFSFFPVFPSKFSGEIDCFGNVNIKAKATDYALLKTLPEKLEGVITIDGKIELTTISRGFEYGGKAMIYELSSDFFYRKGDAVKEFMINKKKLQKMINNYCQ